MYCRTCQECGHIQEAKPPTNYKGDSWTEVKCKRCKSAALNYGSDTFRRNAEGKIVRDSEDDS